MTPLNNPEFVDRVKARCERWPRGASYHHVFSVTGEWIASNSRLTAALDLAENLDAVVVAVIEGTPFIITEVK